MKNIKIAACFAVFLLVGGLGVSHVSAHPVTIDANFHDVGEPFSQLFTHADTSPFESTITVNATNISQNVTWGGFYFKIMDVGWDVTNVDFVVSSPYEPTSTQEPFTWQVNNDIVGAFLHLDFSNDPVGPGELASFTVRIDNTVDQDTFGIRLHPTGAPEPSTIALLGCGTLALIRHRKRRAR
jgi:hypothetical protein